MIIKHGQATGCGSQFSWQWRGLWLPPKGPHLRKNSPLLDNFSTKFSYFLLFYTSTTSTFQSVRKNFFRKNCCGSHLFKNFFLGSGVMCVKIANLNVSRDGKHESRRIVAFRKNFRTSSSKGPHGGPQGPQGPHGPQALPLGHWPCGPTVVPSFGLTWCNLTL